jgi:SAM-dependent methyltransferase
VDTIKQLVLKAHPDWVFEIEDDIIRTHAKRDFISMSTLGHFGQFGNQLFQYAALKAYANRHKVQVEIPEDWPGRKVFLDCNDAVISQAPREQKMIEGEVPFWDNGELKNCDVKGYFQYHTRFHNKDFFRSLFRFKPELEDALATLLKEVRQQASTLVAIHIRMGDYNIPSRSHNIAPTKWYLDWLKENWDKLDNPILFVASDDIDKVRDDFREYDPQTFKGKNFLTDYYILAHSDILLTSNSTFSFTAAMLNEDCKFGKFYRPDFEQGKLISFDPWDAEPVLKVEQALKLHLGCGNKRHEGFVNIDCKKTPATDLICDIRQLPFENNTVDEIECYHVFEHFPVCLHANVNSEYGHKYATLIMVLQEWKRVLKKDGLLVIEMPDLDKTLEAYLKADEDEKDRLLIPIYGR